MSDDVASIEGTLDKPLRSPPNWRLLEVHWSTGRFGILEITAPAGMTFLFGEFTAGSALGGTFTKDDVFRAVTPINLGDPILSELYSETTISYLIGTVVFPDRVPPDPFAYETIKAGIVSPNRFREVQDLRTLDSNEFPYQIQGWPGDGNWSDPTFEWEPWCDGRPCPPSPPGLTARPVISV